MTSAPSGFRHKLVRQFHRPQGMLGQLAGLILANREGRVRLVEAAAQLRCGANRMEHVCAACVLAIAR